MKKIPFLGLAHTARDDRLRYRQVDKIKEIFPDYECAYIGNDSTSGCANDDPLLKVLPINILHTSMPKISRKIWVLSKLLLLSFRYRPHIVQASDIRGCPLG